MTAKPIDGATQVATPEIGSADFAAAHHRLLSESAIQFDLPRAEPPAPPPTWMIDFLSGAAPIMRVLFWVALAIGIAFLVYAIVRRLTGAEWPWRRRKGDEEAEDWRPAEAPARALLGEADALAASGNYSEAAHLLLFRSIDDIDKRRPDLVRPALTSRDISGLPEIPGRPRSAFARIAMMVERSLFGARALGESDWRDCRAAYEEFAFAEGWRG